MAALDAAADVDVVSTLEAEGARLATELAVAEAEEAAGGAPERDELALAQTRAGRRGGVPARALGRACSGGEAPDQAIARVRARTELVARAAVREQQDLDALVARVSSLEERATAAAVRADLLATTSGELEQATEGLHADLGARGRRARGSGTRGRSGPGRQPTRRKRRATAAPPAPRRWSVRCRTSRAPVAASCCATSTGSWARWSTWSRSTTGWDAAFEAAAGAGVAAVVVDGRRAAQAALSTLRERGVTGAVLAPRQSAADIGALPPGSSAEPVRRHVRARQGRRRRGVGARHADRAGRARRRLGGGDRPLARSRRPDRGDDRG